MLTCSLKPAAVVRPPPDVVQTLEGLRSGTHRSEMQVSAAPHCDKSRQSMQKPCSQTCFGHSLSCLQLVHTPALFFMHIHSIMGSIGGDFGLLVPPVPRAGLAPAASAAPVIMPMPPAPVFVPALPASAGSLPPSTPASPSRRHRPPSWTWPGGHSPLQAGKRPAASAVVMMMITRELSPGARFRNRVIANLEGCIEGPRSGLNVPARTEQEHDRPWCLMKVLRSGQCLVASATRDTRAPRPIL
jgi:hypothetical protein